MLRSFGDRATEDLFNRAPTRRVRHLPQDILRRALRRLIELDSATDLSDLAAIPGLRFEKLTGDRAGFYSIRVNDQWRIVFRWEGGDAREVTLVDYHR